MVSTVFGSGLLNEVWRVEYSSAAEQCRMVDVGTTNLEGEKRAMNRTRLAAALLVFAPVLVSHAQGEAQVGALPWQTIADCAAGYRANWQNRLTGFSRSRDMSNMIEMQANDFLEAAIRHYTEQVKSPPDTARQTVTSYVTANVERYVAMDQAETLEAFLDQCPQIEPDPPN
jgi:hypothetical protein